LIAQLLNREFMTAVAQMISVDLRDASSPDDRRSGAPHISDDVDYDEFAVAADALGAAIEKELTGEPPSEDLPGAAEGSEPPTKPREDFVYLPRSREVSLLQSALDRWLTEQASDYVADEPPPDDRRSGGQETAISSAYLPDFPPEESDDRRWFGRFETSSPKVFSDPRWISAVFAMGWRTANGRHDFNPQPALLEDLRPDVRLIIVGDWATGIDRALSVRDRIGEELERGLRDGLEQHVVHLGDVYYSGWKHEYESRFLGPWPVPANERDRIGSWTLNGNHDMYSGGHGYFETCLEDERFERQSRSSWFRIDTPNWRIIGLDSAWIDGDLQEPQPEQVAQWIAEAGGRRIMLLSHHQLFSAYSHDTKGLGEKLAPVLQDGGVDAWFWGHEHRCVLYEPSRGVKYARCVGHGGVPEYMPRTDADPYKRPAAWEFRGRKPKLGQPWNTFGFAVLDFDGSDVQVRYIDEDGNCVYREELN
jgi:hypothetical protein